MADDEQDDFQSKSDANSLLEAHKIRSDGDRHKSAMKHLKSMGDEAQDAHEHEKHHGFATRQKGRMNKAMGPKGKSPYTQASGNQSTPFDEAGE